MPARDRMLPSVLLLLLTGSLTALAQYPSEIVGFNSAPIDDPNASQEMFRIPQTSGTTSAYLVANSSGLFDENWAYRGSGYQTEGAAALRVSFSWADVNNYDSWVRLTTNAGALRPNPALHTEGKVRFKLSNIS